MAPLLVRRIEDRNGQVLEEFSPVKEAEPAMHRAHALTLVNAMRGVMDEGTGSSIRQRYGISANVAGKTGTTQDNTDSCFIMMNSQLVVGARVGCNDNNVTMGSWGQGARSALPMVGDVFQQGFRNRWLDKDAEFDIPRSRPKPAEPQWRDNPRVDIVNNVLGNLLRKLQGN
jgi:penicillin-binding protein 1A